MEVYNEYNNCSRAKIMRREHNKVTDIESMKYFMQYNDYLNDPFSDGEPAESIAARYDLRKNNSMCYGAYDTKLSSVQEMKQSANKTIYLYGGATRQVDPPMNYNSDACQGVKHEGIPDEPDHDWIIFINKFNFDE